jgi:hypothetical protein
MSHWVITYMTGTDASDPWATPTSDDSVPKKIPPKTITVIKTGKTVMVQTTDETGSTRQVWLKDGNQLYRDALGNWSVGPAADSKDPFGQPDYVKSDFAGFDWISAQNFAGIQLIKGDKCLVFRDKVLPLSDQDKGAISLEAYISKKQVDFTPYMVDAEADIDLNTLLPISLKLGNITRVYTYQPPPQAPLELPQAAQVALTKNQQALAPLLRNSAGIP